MVFKEVYLAYWNSKWAIKFLSENILRNVKGAGNQLYCLPLLYTKLEKYWR